MGDNSDRSLDLGGSAVGLTATGVGGVATTTLTSTPYGPLAQSSLTAAAAAASSSQAPGLVALSPGDEFSGGNNNSPPKSTAVTSTAGVTVTTAATTTTNTAATTAGGVTSNGNNAVNAVNVTTTARAKRRREEAVRRLVADIQARHKLGGPTSTTTTTTTTGPDGSIVDRLINHEMTAAASSSSSSSLRESQDWIIASTVAVALERGLDRDLHHELVQEAKENSGRIGQVCHDHSDVFLASVGKVVALGGPSADLANKLRTAQEELELKTAGPMQQAAMLWEEATASHARARALYVMVQACHKVAIQLERARKQASLGRPRGALEAVDEARTGLTAPLSSLFYGKQMEHANQILKDAAKKKLLEEEKKDDGPGTAGGTTNSNNNSKGIMSLEETPFGRRASLMLPKIENEVLMGARRGLNRWFLSLRSGGDGAKAGRAVLRRCAHSLAVGPGNLGLGGHMPPAYLWRAKVCDNLISRMNQNGRVVRSVRSGYWFERDAPKEAQRLESTCPPGMERRAEGTYLRNIPR
jgi:hypothetical protein